MTDALVCAEHFYSLAGRGEANINYSMYSLEILSVATHRILEADHILFVKS